MGTLRRRMAWLLTGALVAVVGCTLLVLLTPFGRWGRAPDAGAVPADDLPGGVALQEQAHFSNGDDRLAGVLVLPSTPGPHPAVAFINGSGATDRTGHGLVPPLARHFARHGFASLAWDRPGVGGSTGDFEAQTFADRAAEALAAVRFLRSRPEVRPDQVGIWGFSQGGIVAPLVASQSADMAFLIEVSGCQTPAWQQDIFRVEAELRADAFPEADVAEAVAFSRRRMDLMRRAGPFEELDRAQQEVRNRPWFEYVHYCDRKRFDSGTVTVGFDPGPFWDSVRCPVLAIFGEKDTSCPLERSVAVVRRGLERAGNADVTIRVFPRAGHGLTVSDTGGRKDSQERARTRREGAEPEFVSGYPEAMSEWLTARFGSRR